MNRETAQQVGSSRQTEEAPAARAYPGLDLIRLLAALMVAMYHFAFFHPLHNHVLPMHQLADWGWCGVQVFFVISGFVIAFSASRKNAAQFVASRAGRLYPAAWICATISMFVAPRPIADYIRSITLFPLGPWVNGVYWTLAVEVAFYALIAVALWRRWSLHVVAIALGSFSALCWLVRSVGFDVPVGPFGHYGCYFAFGMLLFERRSIAFAALFFLAGMVGVYWAAAALAFGFWAPFVWAVSALFCVAVVFGNEWVCRVTRAWPTRTLGLMTYPLYLVHDSVGTPILRFGIAASIIASLAVAFAILPLEGFIRRRVFGPLHDRLPTGNPL